MVVGQKLSFRARVVSFVSDFSVSSVSESLCFDHVLIPRSLLCRELYVVLQSGEAARKRIRLLFTFSPNGSPSRTAPTITHFAGKLGLPRSRQRQPELVACGVGGG